jgi:hypothetical protein
MDTIDWGIEINLLIKVLTKAYVLITPLPFWTIKRPSYILVLEYLFPSKSKKG